jgi:asparagine synthase (glutamine-hydrolysing)
VATTPDRLSKIMCGIAGIFHYRQQDRPADRAIVTRMTDVLAHRGPNGAGVMISGPIGFGHRRLSIIDLTETGSQPMTTPDGSLWISYNGEFYNHAGFRRELSSRHVFRGTSDTETFLNMFRERGPACFHEVMGIFGVAFWDQRQHQLVLARDHLGVKQLYYYDDGESILFASEIKALLATGLVPREIDAEALNQYLHFHTPLFERTFFRHVRQLRAGEYMQIDAHGPRRHQYWTVPLDRAPIQSGEEAIEQVRETLKTVIGEQLLADVSVGSFFSGGIDSSAVAAFAKRAGRPPQCFGVHFQDSSVVDERPFQEAAAQALGLELNLITMDGSTFPDDLCRLLRYQDQPVVGAAMLPMYYVSKLAASKVRVCLGGQAADEVFGGYARYGLTEPLALVRSWLVGRQGEPAEGQLPEVGGNLRKQLLDATTIVRMVRSASLSWERRYFDHFAKVPLDEWRSVIAADELVSRDNCWQTFTQAVARSAAKSPADKAMHWDVQTYLTGLFQQDDRMSMANGLESRVPLADPRIVELAFRIPSNFKFRSGASKWVLRQAIADVLPAMILSRRKIGFDTPAKRWMRESHRGFVRDMLLDRTARERGFWSTRGLERLLDQTKIGRNWFDIVWKVLCIEAWARECLDSAPRPAGSPSSSSVIDVSPPRNQSMVERVRDFAEEVQALTPEERKFRFGWELSIRSGATRLLEPNPRTVADTEHLDALVQRLPFPSMESVRTVIAPYLGSADLDKLRRDAEWAEQGRLECFGRWMADFGHPIDWHVNPVSGRRWKADVHWSHALGDEARVGDVKLSWEIARFPQAYSLVRTATMVPGTSTQMASLLAGQISSFVAKNPYGKGINWASGQEIVVRLLAWLFALSAFRREPAMRSLGPLMQRSLYESTQHVDRYIVYAEKAVYNNHLIAEALGLLVAGLVLPAVEEAASWRTRGLESLDGCLHRQFKADGAYIQNSHNYQRTALQYLLWMRALLRHHGMPLPPLLDQVLERSLDFLYSHQNPSDGRLPNFGSNDTSLPSPLSSCDHSDFRSVLQAVSIAVRGERLYSSGPWDEDAAWLCGVEAVKDAPLRPLQHKSRSFMPSGYHVLRGKEDGCFGTFRCGNVVDRFAQIDMLSLDVWWRGVNVIADAGSFLYNGPARWHEHFFGTAAHSTVQVDGLNQMLHHRRFKALLWTRARLLRFEDNLEWGIVEGEHYGFQRSIPGCIHRRSVLFIKDEMWIVVDTVTGSGAHEVALQWLGGTPRYSFEAERSTLMLETEVGPFFVAVAREDGTSLEADVVAGQGMPVRGWLSRYYGEKVAVPSMQAHSRQELPVVLVTGMAPERPEFSRVGNRWRVQAGARECSFVLEDGRFKDVQTASLPSHSARKTK